MVGAIIQARMTSTRLPGKVLKKINGKTVFSYLIERLKCCKLLDKIILATTVNSADDPLAEAGRKENLLVYRGSEDDVLDRYYQAAVKYKVDDVVRVTSDCPLLDPVLCDDVVREYKRSGADFVHTGPSFSEGLDCEAFSFKVLEHAWKSANLKSEREHITMYLHNHPEIFKKITVHNSTDDSKYRFTIDSPEDFKVVSVVLENLYKAGNPNLLSPSAIKTFFDNNPDIYKVNAHIIRNEGLIKSLKNDEVVKP